MVYMYTYIALKYRILRGAKMSHVCKWSVYLTSNTSITNQWLK